MRPSFRYTARRFDGEAVAGTLVAPSRDRAIAHLSGRALFITSLTPIDETRQLLARMARRFSSDGGARVACMRSMATLISAGVALRRSIEIVTAQCADAGYREALRSIAADLDEGVALGEAVARRPHEFPAYASALIRAGERSGALDEVFTQLAAWTERERAVQSRLLSAIAYPAFVATTGTALLLLLVVQTVPSFAAMFSQLNVQLPPSTRFLLWLGHLTESPRAWAVGTACALTMLAAIGAGMRSKACVSAGQRLQLRLPVYGLLLRKRLLARFARCLSMLLRCGVELLPAIGICQDVVAHPVYASALSDVTTALHEGQPLSARLYPSLFDPFFVQLVRVGEETGALDPLLLRLAVFYENDLDDALNGLSSLLEPALILAMGTAVGAIAAAVLVPFYSLVGSIR